MISLSLYDDFQGWHIQRNVQVDNLDQATRHKSQWEIQKTDHGSYATKNPVEQRTVRNGGIGGRSQNVHERRKRNKSRYNLVCPRSIDILGQEFGNKPSRIMNPVVSGPLMAAPKWGVAASK